MQNENIKKTNNIELKRYEIAVSEILNNMSNIDTAVKVYELDMNMLSVFIHTVLTKGKVIKGDNKNISLLDTLAFLLYAKICPQEHCVCLACFKKYLPNLIYKFLNHNNINYPQIWDTCQKADEFDTDRFLKIYNDDISKLFLENCLELSPNNLRTKSLILDDNIDEYKNI